MKVQDLKQYKPLDITQLPAEKWNTAEKVLGLDENDKVVMAEPEEVVTPEYVDNAIDQAMEVETARTESTYLKEHQSLDDYYTKEEVDQAIEDVEVDLSDYYTKAEVDEAIENVDVSDQLANYALISSVTADINTAIANETARTENTYAKPSDIPSLDGYAKTTAVTQDIQTAITSETARTEGAYIKQTNLPYALTSFGGGSSPLNSWIEFYGQNTNTTGAFNILRLYYSKINGKNIMGLSPTASGFVGNIELPTFSDVSTAITDSMETETARTENVYAKKSEIPDLDNYYTKSETDEAIEDAISGISLEGYWTSAQTKNYVDAEITGATASETARTESTYAKKSEIPSLDGYATEQYVDNAIADIPPVDLSAYAKTTAVTQDIQTAIAAETGRTEDAYIKKSLYSGYNEQYSNSITAIKKGVFNVGGEQYDCISNEFVVPTSGARGGGITDIFIKKINGESIIETLSGIQAKQNIELPTFSDVSTAITDSMQAETARTENVYAKKSEIPSLNGYATEDYVDSSVTAATATTTGWVESQGYLTQHQDISGKLDASTFNTYTGATETVLEGKADISDIPDVSDFVTSGEVATQIDTAIAAETARTESTYLKEHQDISSKLDVSTFNTYTGATETVLNGKADISDIPDVSGFVTSGDVETQIGTAMATETARTESTYAKKSEIPDLDGYWTSAQTQNAITAATEGLATEAWVTGDTDTRIGTAMASETARTESTYLKEHQDISGKLDVSVFTGYTGTTETTLSGKLDKTDFNTYTGATETVLSGKVDYATFTGYTGDTQTALAGKQETLVSGTNIKTINNQSLLGSGNIDIQGGGGGGSVVELTKAQYDALDPPAQDTTYIITDAETVDLNDYAMASGLTELSGTVETIGSNYATKQNVTARASNSNYLPGWNAQGVITGSTAYYNKSQGINGTNYNVFSNSNTNHPAIFAPTSAGTAGQPLLSNGSGEPVWGSYKFAFISQSQYDALTTPDSTTIYFIVDPN